jgi:hypothetical protein
MGYPQCPEASARGSRSLWISGRWVAWGKLADMQRRISSRVLYPSKDGNAVVDLHLQEWTDKGWVLEHMTHDKGHYEAGGGDWIRFWCFWRKDD